MIYPGVIVRQGCVFALQSQTMITNTGWDDQSQLLTKSTVASSKITAKGWRWSFVFRSCANPGAIVRHICACFYCWIMKT
jgi:hypothetical protein